MRNPPSPLYHCGEFVLDAASGELRRNGSSVRLQPQPLQVLIALLNRPGEVVSRDELGSLLWADDTNVEFDDGLNHAIRRLRDALSDTAQVPRYIETIPRRGYRLIAPVEFEVSQTQTEPAPITMGHFHRLRWLLVAAVGTAIAILAAMLVVHHNSTQISSLAVLPLTDFSGIPDQHFADGITEELTTELARIKDLRVISRTSAMRMRDTKLSLQEIGRELHVDAVVEGSVQRSGNRVRISAQLVRVANERHLWAENYERELRDVLQVRSEIARDIASRVRERIAPEQAAKIARSEISPAAYDAYLVGTRLASHGGNEGFEQSIPYFEKAIKLDPDFALAYAELGESHGMLAFNAGERNHHFAEGLAAVYKALELDPFLPEAQTGTADIGFYWSWDWSQCEGTFRKAAENYPYSAHVQYHYGLCLFVLGRYDQALEYLDNARRVDPLSPMINRAIGHLLGAMGRNQEAIEQLLKTRDLEPNNPATYKLLSWAYGRAERESESVSSYITSCRLAGDPVGEIEILDKLYRTQGKSAFENQRRKILKARLYSLIYREKERTVRPLTLAYLCAATGETDLAFEYLNKAYDERSPNLTWIKSNPFLEALHDDPRFHTLIHRMGLPD